MPKRTSTSSNSRKKPSAYERKAIHAIHAWKNPKSGWFDKAWEAIDWPLSKATTAIKKIPGVQWTIDKGTPPVEWVLQKSVGGLVTLLNDGAHWSVRPKAIYSDFSKCGLNVNSHRDIVALDLEHVDRALGWLDVKYKSIAAAEGGSTGAAGLPGKRHAKHGAKYGVRKHGVTENMGSSLGLDNSRDLFNPSSELLVLGHLQAYRAAVPTHRRITGDSEITRDLRQRPVAASLH